MYGKYLNKILEINAKHALYRKDGGWYHNLKSFPGVLFDENGYVIFFTEEEYKSNPKLTIRQDLNVNDRIENLENYQKFTESQLLLINGIEIKDLDTRTNNNEETIRVLRTIDAILRKKTLINRIKKLYNNTCQICGMQLKVGAIKYYSEVHHIIPLGRPHNGIDSLDNMICVCPNCHVQLDLKSIPLDKKLLVVSKHEINDEYITKHNLSAGICFHN